MCMALINIVPINDIGNSRIFKDIQIPCEVINNVDELVDLSTSIAKIYVYHESTSDILDALVE